MIVWLASYPRSGNTFLRIMIEHVFGQRTFSLYDEQAIKVGKTGLEIAEPGSADPFDPERFYIVARDSERIHFLKTHDAPQDDAPAIYIERDGRAASVSYYHYVKTFEDSNATMADIVLGRVQFGSWSEHIQAWNPMVRPRTILLRFEELVRTPSNAANDIASFLNLKEEREFVPNWSHLNSVAPKFFRKGDNEANIAELTGRDADIFWAMHGRMMLDRKYVEEIPNVPMITRELLIEQRDRWGAVLTNRHRKIVDEIEADRAERVQINRKLEAELREIDRDRHAKEEMRSRMAAELEAISADRIAKEKTIESLVDQLVAIDGDRRAKDVVIAKLSAELEALRADHGERGKVIERLVLELNELKARR